MTIRVTLFFLLCAFALLGGIDIGYFHLYRYKLSSRRSSRWEQVTHLVRTAVFLAALLWVMVVDARGIFSLVLPGLLALDLLNSLTDVALEPHSRRSLGGLPAGEYFIHMLSMFVSGAIMAIAVIGCVGDFQAPDSMRVHALALPVLWIATGLQVALVTAGFFIVETVGFVRALLRPPRA